MTDDDTTTEPFQLERAHLVESTRVHTTGSSSAPAYLVASATWALTIIVLGALAAATAIGLYWLAMRAHI